MSNLHEVISNLPEGDHKVVLILSGGLDSTIAMRLAIERYGVDNVTALTFDYGQRQRIEIEHAKASTTFLGVPHKIIDANFLFDISQGFSANVDTSIKMPTIKEVLGDPTPKTYVPNRNMILLSIAAAYAETQGADLIFCGLQSVDEYGYWDTTTSFTESMNAVLNQNRKLKIRIMAPFNKLTKVDELRLLQELDGDIGLAHLTISCYNPDEDGLSCGVCPTCSERVNNFIKFGAPDVKTYQIEIPWERLISAK